MMDASAACVECMNGLDGTGTPHLIAEQEHSTGQILIENTKVLAGVIADTQKMVDSMCAVNRVVDFGA